MLVQGADSHQTRLLSEVVNRYNLLTPLRCFSGIQLRMPPDLRGPFGRYVHRLQK